MVGRIFLYSVIALSVATISSAQDKAQGQPSGGSGSFAGVSFEASKLPKDYPQMKRSRVIWYKLVQSDKPDRSTQPLMLLPISCADEQILPPVILNGDGFSKACQDNPDNVLWHSPDYPDRRHPLLDGDHLVVGIVDPDNLITNGKFTIKFVTLNVQASNQTPLNPAPQRSPIAPPGGGGGGQNGSKGPGAELTRSVSKCTMSKTGDDQQVLVGSAVPISLSVTLTADSKPQLAVPVEFTVMPAKGASGSFPSASLTAVSNTDSSGSAAAPRLTAGDTAGTYQVNAVATCPADGSRVSASFNMKNLARTYYLPWNQQLTGDTVPVVTVTFLYETPAPQASKAGNGQLQARDANGQQQAHEAADSGPADQAVLSVTDQLPQVHAMYAYNLSFGVLGSTVKEPSFTRIANAPPCPMGVAPPGNQTSGTCGTFANSTSTSAAVEPVVFFTTYVPQRFDAESHWHPLEMVWPLAPSIGISLTQPSTDFFFGQSSEIRRGVELVYGWHAARVSYVLPGEDPTSSASPPTGRQWKSGFFYGVTFTLNFVQSLFSGGGK